MSTNVEPEEAEAIRDILDEGDEGHASVVDRDFREPRRLSAASIAELSRRLSGVVTNIERRVSANADTTWPMTLADVSEISANGLFDGEDDDGPFAALRFQAADQIGWIVWESQAAVRAVETVLGSASESVKGRMLSIVECTVLQGLLAPVADETLSELDIEASGAVIAQSKEALGDWLDVGDAADPHRLHVEFSIEGPGEASTIHVYVPAPGDVSETASETAKLVEVPDHLSPVEIEISVRLEGCSVSLDQLLELEEGDVIPLDGRVGDPALVCVDGRTIGVGLLGTRHGQLALRIEQLKPQPEETE